MVIRKEYEKDYSEVENLTREAFWNVYRPGCVEHYVLHVLRNDPAFVPELDYVIEDNGEIKAHIAYALGDLKTISGNEKVLLFGPLSVLPKEQGKGYGGKLIKYTLNKAKEMGYKAVFITGNPQYYSRFGFESASKYGIFYNGMDTSEEAPFFMVKFLDKSEAERLKGIYYDPQCYFPDKKLIDEFDSKFPPKKKEKLAGQLEN